MVPVEDMTIFHNIIAFRTYNIHSLMLYLLVGICIIMKRVFCSMSVCLQIYPDLNNKMAVCPAYIITVRQVKAKAKAHC